MNASVAFITGATLGIAQTAHCLGMCGVFAVRAGTDGASGLARYVLGKLFTYVFLGVLLGAVGGHALAGSENARVAVTVTAGTLLLLAGLRKVLPIAIQERAPSLAFDALTPASGTAITLPGGAWSLGALTGALPCGASGLALLQAASSGSTWIAASFMAGFAFGTAPAALLGAFGGQWLTRRIPKPVLVRGGGALLMIVGGVMIVRSLLPILTGETCCG
ncbi:MAG: hypothetical protein RIS21_1411 [Planctomycetota bacterium]